jgi:hypothetical protein
MAQRAIRSPANICIQEGKAAISLHLQSELDFLVDTVHVVDFILHLIQSIGQDDENIICLVEPTEGLMGFSAEHRHLSVLHEEVGNPQ